MINIIYLHGFNSAFNPNNDLVVTLGEIGDVVGINYDSYDTYDNIFEDLRDHLSDFDSDETVIVGTSLGGFWAAEMAAALGFFSVIINPCYDPASMLQKHVGPQTNYGTGEVRNFQQASVDSYAGHETISNNYRFLPLVLLDLGDQVIDSALTSDVFDGYPQMCYDGGSHRFEHMNEGLSEIRQYVNRCQHAEQLN